MPNRVNVAIVQDFPELFQPQRTLVKLESLVSEAAKSGAQLVLFPEAFVGGYPRGLSFGTVIGSRSDEGRELWLEYSQSCPVENGPEIERLKKIAKQFNVYLVVGVIERAMKGGSLYCSILYFSPEGELVGRHRKLKPTAAERILWADGKIEDALCVVGSPLGRIGGLICWENYMPLARMALYQQGVEIYCAPMADQRDRWHHSMVHVALEGRCFVLSANQFVPLSSLPAGLVKNHQELDQLSDPVCRGGSMIVAPCGEIIAGPIWDKEAMLIATIDLSEVQKAKMDFDVVGHYARDSVFRFEVKKSKAFGDR